MDERNLDRTVEAILFVADGSVNVAELARAAGADPAEVEAAVARLVDASGDRGVCVVRSGDRVQMATAPDMGPVIEKFLGVSQANSLSSAALEALSIIAYRQPVTRAQIDAVRGVNSDGVVRTLVARQLVQPVGRLQQAGRPVLYGTTFEFLQYLGVTSLDDLPTLPDLGEALEELLESQQGSLDIEQPDAEPSAPDADA